MLGLNDRNLFLIAVAIYGLSAIYSFFLWRQGFKKDNLVNYGLLLFGFAFHTSAMLARGISFSRCPVNNLYEATVFIAWTIVTAYLVIGMSPRFRFLGAFTAPLLFGIGVFALMPALDPNYGPNALTMRGWQSSLHAALILLAYGTFGIASIASAMYLSQEYNLKFNKLKAVLAFLPSIERLENAASRLVVIGFVLLTAGLGVGLYWLRQTHGVILTDDFKIVWSFLVWFLYLGLLLMRRNLAQSGHKMAWGTVGSFLFVILTFWGASLLSNIHNP